MRIVDERGASVPFEAPEMTCSGTLAGKTKNGQAGWLTMTINGVPAGSTSK